MTLRRVCIAITLDRSPILEAFTRGGENTEIPNIFLMYSDILLCPLILHGFVTNCYRNKTTHCMLYTADIYSFDFGFISWRRAILISVSIGVHLYDLVFCSQRLPAWRLEIFNKHNGDLA